jgi:S-adenosylmethionine:tRNA ribosyltransferase-isomerase
MHLDEFDYELPAELIAQQPLAQRDASRLLRLDRRTGALEDRMFADLPEMLRPGDLLVANDSRVFPARLTGHLPLGGAVEALLLAQVGPGVWDALARPGRKLPVGARLAFPEGVCAEVIARGAHGERRLRFEAGNDFPADFNAWLERHGHVPLPPYIHRGMERPGDRERYQTVYARPRPDGGSAAAPTAGLHFTPEVLARLAARGIEWTTVSLDVGLGTFQPVNSERIEDHPMHSEHYAISAPAAALINAARRDGRRIVAVGTTAIRVLETAGRESSDTAGASGEVAAGAGESRLFLYPGSQFHMVDALLTNFHAPRTTLLMLIAAFAGLENVRRAYQHAMAERYRFLSYGDCMLIE